MDLRSALTDDQLVILGCFVALAVCGGLAMLSHTFGPVGRRERKLRRQTIEVTRPIRTPVAEESAAATRRAA